MKIRNVMIGAALAAMASLTACGGAGTGPANAPVANGVAPGKDTAKVQPKILKDEAGPDNSHVVIRQLESGDTVAVRRWNAGEIKKVTKRTKAGVTRAIRVVFRNEKIFRVEDPAAIEHALDWTGAQIADVARKSGKNVDEPAGEGDEDEPAEKPAAKPAASNANRP